MALSVSKPKIFLRIFVNIVWVFSLAIILASCSSGKDDTAAPHFSIGGTVNGLTGSGLVLQNKAGDDLSISANGTFTFATSLTSGTTYAVTVMTQPTVPSQTCIVSNSSGTIANSDVTNVTVVCTTNSYSVGGTVSGLAGRGLLLQNNASDDLSISANGTFTFATPVTSGTTYAVTVKTQPTILSQTCTVSSDSGTVAAGNVDNVLVNCVTPPPRFAYVTNNGYRNVSAYTINGTTGALTEMAGSPFATGLLPVYVIVDPTGKFAYVANMGDDNVSAFTINISTGALTPVTGSPFATGDNPFSVAMVPTGKFIYVANGQSSNVSAYAINASTGALTPVSGSPFAAGENSFSIAVDPAGKFVYVANYYSSNVSAYTINASTGALTEVDGSPFATGGISYPYTVTVDPTGKFAYVTNMGSNNNISAYIINASTGALTPVTGSPFAAGRGPGSITVDPTGKFAYVSNAFDNNVSAFTIDSSTGALTPMVGSPFVAGINPVFVTVDPSGKFAYVTNSAGYNVSVYTIDAITGTLTQVAGSPFATGTGPSSIAIMR